MVFLKPWAGAGGLAEKSAGGKFSAESLDFDLKRV
jgi:hypothetical protein